MAAINFPSSPSINDEFTDAGITWIWTGTEWNVVPDGGGLVIPPIDAAYSSQSVMIANQGNQTPNYIYYDGTSYWEYLGTTNGNITDYREIGGGGGDIILYFENTYSQVLALSQAGQLVTGATYKITDYQTIHVIPNTTDINTGPTEPLLVKAISSSEIDKRATSTLYPNDIIEYDFDNNLAENGTTPTKGLILFRHDLINDVSTLYDWRQVRFRRWFPTLKRTEFIVATDTNVLQINTQYISLSGTTFDTNALRIHARTVNEFTSAGTLTLTITNGTTIVTRPLIKSDGTETWSTNEILNRTGLIINCNVRNVFIFDYSASYGNEVINLAICPYNNPTFSVGDGIVYEVNQSSFVDYLTFNSTALSVHLGLRTQVNYNSGASRFNNTVFLGAVTHSEFGPHVTNSTFTGPVTMSTIEGEAVDSVFVGTFYWSHGLEIVYSYIVNAWHAEMNKGHIDRSTIYPGNFGYAFEKTVEYSTVRVDSFGGNFYNWIRYSYINLSAIVGGVNPTAFNCSVPITNSILGLVDGNLVDLRAPLRNTSFFVLEYNGYATYTNSVNVKNPPTSSSGTTQNIVIDENGNLVKVPFNNLSETTQSGNTSLVVIKHPDGVAPEDSATVGQLTAFGNQLEASLNLRTFGITIDGASNPITTGIKGYLIIPYNCEILAWYIVSDTVGSIEIDVWKAASIPTGANSICGTDRPKLVSVQENQNETLTLWTIGVTSGDVVAFNVISANTVTRVNLIIKTKVVV
jgi:hypothetical protein